MMNRRNVLQAGWSASLALGPTLGLAQNKPEKLTILSHRVHMSVLTGAKGGDATAEWVKRNAVGIDWVTLDTGPLHERLFREASLGSTSIDLAFMVNTRATPNVANLLEPLDGLLKSDPLEDTADLFPGLVAAMKFGGKQYAVPQRHATTGFHYNEAIFQERGVAVPKTFEEVIEA
ncbi:MAG: extracellular solute-binding protein, partial [Rhodoferax sp.]|nr:extracellular solute-binding protein [Rhodoferax sp.]